jgi:hypothetical protein
MLFDDILKKSMPISLPFSNPSFISLFDSPIYKAIRPCLTISPIKIVDVVVPSPANRFVEFTDFLMSVQTASFKRSS